MNQPVSTNPHEMFGSVEGTKFETEECPTCQEPAKGYYVRKQVLVCDNDHEWPPSPE